MHELNDQFSSVASDLLHNEYCDLGKINFESWAGFPYEGLGICKVDGVYILAGYVDAAITGNLNATRGLIAHELSHISTGMLKFPGSLIHRIAKAQNIGLDYLEKRVDKDVIARGLRLELIAAKKFFESTPPPCPSRINGYSSQQLEQMLR